jgi:NitT/TauT family transport system ATP-binding protein
MATISVNNLRKEFLTADGLVVALEDATFEASGHTFVSVVGPSGCGKSTLLNVLCGIDEPTSGTATITQDGHAARTGYVFQDARLLPWRTVMANMLFVQNDTTEETKSRCLHYLDMVGLAHATQNFPGQLSGGMQQRVGIARAFSIEPDVLLMDEPFSHLDAITGRGLRSELHDIWMETQKTVLFVTHDVGEAVELSTRILLFARGGHLQEDMKVDLPFPRDPTSDTVALYKADIMRKFETLNVPASAVA